MTTEEAIEYWEQFNSEIDELATYDLYEEQIDELEQQREVVEFTISALRAQQEQSWISVKDRLPEMSEPVIVRRQDGRIQSGMLDVNGWWKVYGTRTKTVTHWMPLPEVV